MLTQTADARPYALPSRLKVRTGFEPEKSIGLFRGKEKAFGPNEDLFNEGDPADCIFMITRGAVRSYKLLGEGRRKIEAFRLRGDVFGFDPGTEREFCAQAIDEVCVLIARRHSFVDAATSYETMRELCAVSARELRRVQQHTLLLAMTAPQRMACFLIEMLRRLGERHIVELPMSRQDIADYLGLSIETVSRAFARFEASGLISLPTSRHIVLHEPEALQRMCE